MSELEHTIKIPHDLWGKYQKHYGVVNPANNMREVLTEHIDCVSQSSRPQRPKDRSKWTHRQCIDFAREIGYYGQNAPEKHKSSMHQMFTGKFLDGRDVANPVYEKTAEQISENPNLAYLVDRGIERLWEYAEKNNIEIK